MGYIIQLIRFVVVWGIVIYIGYLGAINILQHDAATTTVTVQKANPIKNIPTIHTPYSPQNNLSQNNKMLEEIQNNNNLSLQRKKTAIRKQKDMERNK